MNARKAWSQLTAGLLIAAVCVLPAGADILTFYPTHDTFLDEYSPSHVYGANVTLSLRNTSNGPWGRDTLARFDISSIPAGTAIPSATLNLYYWAYRDNNPAGRPLTCYRITEDWNEAAATWNFRPGRSSQSTAQTTVPGTYGWLQWDVTSDVQAFVNGQQDDYGWMITDETYWGGANIPITDLRAREYGSFMPYLEVVPEPANLLMLSLGGLVLIRRRS